MTIIATLKDTFFQLSQRLTPQQYAAACHEQGHARVLAVAGAGKSSMLIARIAWLLREGVSAKRIRVLTYNREAADDFRRRLDTQIGSLSLVVQTFHALGWKLLQRLMSSGHLPPWRLANAGQESALKREALQRTQKDQDQLENLGQALEWVKSQALPLDLALAMLPEGLRELSASVQQLEALREQAQVWFFTDMLHAPWQVLQQSPDLRAEFANHLDHLLVDEYQDINEVQHVLLTWLAGSRAQVMVVGDVDQCIYTWRGASPNFLAQRFAEDFTGAVCYALPHTFRFGHRLALLANHAISPNVWPDRQLVLAAESTPDTRVSVHVGRDADQVQRILSAWRETGRSWQDAAVLVRLWAQAAPIELALLQVGIPYRLLGDRSIWDSSVAQGLMALLALASGQLWQQTYETRLQALTAFWQLPPLGLPRAPRERLTQLSAQSPEMVVSLIESLPCEREWLKNHWRKRGDLWQQLREGMSRLSAKVICAQFVIDSDAINRLEKLSGTPQQGSMQAGMLRALLEVLPEQMTAEDALALLQNMRAQSLQGQQQADAVSLTSIHRVKGREWPCVVMAGLHDGAFPGDKSSEQPALLEEERRLFYVGITRAQHALHLVVPDDSVLGPLWQKGATGESAGLTCRFLAQTNLEVCDHVGAKLHGADTPWPTGVEFRQVNAYLQHIGMDVQLMPKMSVHPGKSVQHDRFGSGMIMSHRDDKIEVAFADGIRWLQADHPSLVWQ